MSLNSLSLFCLTVEKEIFVHTLNVVPNIFHHFNLCLLFFYLLLISFFYASIQLCDIVTRNSLTIQRIQRVKF